MNREKCVLFWRLRVSNLLMSGVVECICDDYSGVMVELLSVSSRPSNIFDSLV